MISPKNNLAVKLKIRIFAGVAALVAIPVSAEYLAPQHRPWFHLLAFVVGFVTMFRSYGLINRISESRVSSEVKKENTVSRLPGFFERKAAWLRFIWNTATTAGMLYVMWLRTDSVSVIEFAVILTIVAFLLMLPDWLFAELRRVSSGAREA